MTSIKARRKNYANRAIFRVNKFALWDWGGGGRTWTIVTNTDKSNNIFVTGFRKALQGPISGSKAVPWRRRAPTLDVCRERSNVISVFRFFVVENCLQSESIESSCDCRVFTYSNRNGQA
jgi:hypothetical protein